jgi:NTP pyrophosphatase (non-canonical NTP hydrolase)
MVRPQAVCADYLFLRLPILVAEFVRIQPGRRGAKVRILTNSATWIENKSMPDATTPLATLKDAVRRFADERDWEQFHSPKNLSMGLAVEAAELMEHFLWVDSAASREVVHDEVRLGQVADELADVGCHLLNMSNALGIDLSEAILAKIAKNALKYPADKVRGRYRVPE